MSLSKDKNFGEGQLNPAFISDEEKAYPPGIVDTTVDKTVGNPTTPTMEYEPGESRRMMKNVILISFSFTFLFTAFNSMAALQSSINKDGGLGNYSQSTLYGALVVSSMFMPTILIRKFTVKWTLFMSMFGYAIYIAAQFSPSFGTLIPAAIVLGVCAAPLWSSKCTYLTLLGSQYASLTNDNAEVIVVRFFGIFFLFFQSSSIWGNLISSAVLSGGDIEENTNDLGTCGVNYCPPKDSDDEDEPDSITDSKRYTISTIYLICAFVAAAMIGLLVDPLIRYGEKLREGGTSELSGVGLLMATFKHMAHPYQILIIPLTIWSGLEQGFLTADYTQAFITCAWGVEKVGYVLICYGVCDALASVTFGPIIRRTGRIPVFIFGALVNIGVLIVMRYVWTPDPDSYILFFVFAGLWGVADAIWQTQINAFYGVIFPDNSEPAFSNYRLWESLGFILAYIESNLVCIKTKIYVLFGVLILGMVGYLYVEFLEFQKSKASKQKREEVSR